MISEATLLSDLAGQAEKAGGWGYTTGQGAHLEPTCLALLALHRRRTEYAETIDSGMRFLASNALSD